MVQGAAGCASGHAGIVLSTGQPWNLSSSHALGGGTSHILDILPFSHAHDIVGASLVEESWRFWDWQICIFRQPETNGKPQAA